MNQARPEPTLPSLEHPARIDLFFTRHLLEKVAPFWMRFALDRRTGTLQTCIADDGTILSTDLYMWSQLRAIWTFSALYHRIERRQEWLDAAARLVEFCLRHGRNEAGEWLYRVDPEGKPVDGPISIYADGFAMYGLTEYFRATGDRVALQAALDTFESVQRRLREPGPYPVAPYSIPDGARAHGISMIFSLVFHELAEVSDDPAIRAAASLHAEQVLEVFLRRETGLVLEYVRLDGGDFPGGLGRVILPGHAIESMWFMIHLYRTRGDRKRILQAIQTMRRHLEIGWDSQFGGLFLAVDSQGLEPAWPHWEKKLWWPHTEALYALILARQYSQEPWITEWYQRVQEYSFTRFPDPVHGEWTQRLDREGKKVTEVVALPVKDPFHLPRALILSLEACRQPISQNGPFTARSNPRQIEGG